MPWFDTAGVRGPAARLCTRTPTTEARGITPGCSERRPVGVGRRSNEGMTDRSGFAVSVADGDRCVPVGAPVARYGIAHSRCAVSRQLLASHYGLDAGRIDEEAVGGGLGDLLAGLRLHLVDERAELVAGTRSVTLGE